MNAHVYIKVIDVMTPNPSLIDGLASAREAIEIMRDQKVSSLVFDRRHEGDEYGILSVHDVAGKVIAKGRSAERASVYEIMSKPVLCVDVAMDVKYAIRLLSRFRLTRALVTEHGLMVGIVTFRDMAVRYTGP